MSINPICRLFFKLGYQTPTSGRSWLLGPGDFGEELTSKYIDFKKLMAIKPEIYINAYNLTKQEIQLFINRQNHKKYQPITLRALKANSSILGYLKNPTIGKDKYCEGAVVDTVNFRDLLNNHPDLDEVWVINILDYKEIKPPTNQLEADLLAVELPFTSIAQDDIKLFGYHLKEQGLDNQIKIIKIDASYSDLNFFWKRSTLEKGIELGYKGAIATIEKYLKKSKGPTLPFHETKKTNRTEKSARSAR